MNIKTKEDERVANHRTKKTLTIYPFNQKFPTVYESTIELFSKRYNLNYYPRKWSTFYQLKDNRFIRNSYYFVMRILRKFLKNKPKISAEKNLLFCFNQLPPQEFEFIIDLENVTGLANYDYSKIDKEYISKRLGNKKCKAIMCWNQASYEGLTKTIDCSKFKNKINVIPFGGDDSKLQKKHKKSLNFLFVSSVNNPISFETKGGLIALETYAKLAKKYKNIKFFVRANISKKLVKEYKDVPGLVFLTKYLSENKMKELFSYSDILLVPIPGIDLFSKCMEFGIPAVSFDYGVAYEIIDDNKTGFLIDSSKIFKYRNNIEKLHNNENKYYQLLFKKEECLKFVPEFTKKSEILIKNKNLLNKMTKNQHSLVEDGGKYSLKKRNQKLIKLIDPHMVN